MKKIIALILTAAICVLSLAACGTQEPAAESVSPSAAPSPEGSIEVVYETGAVTVEYYDGTEMIQAEQSGTLLIQVPQGAYLEKINVYAPEGKVEIIGVLAAQYDIETVGHDIDIYLPEGTAFHVMLSTISDLFESDFPYDVTATKHEYIYLSDGVEIILETVIGVARVMVLK